MSAKLFASALIAAVGFAAAPSFAGDVYAANEVGYVSEVSASTSGLTREAVRADVLQAMRDDTMPQVGEGADLGAVATTRSTLSRAAVRAEAVYAVQHGLIAAGEV
jgi:hypothetical protein